MFSWQVTYGIEIKPKNDTLLEVVHIALEGAGQALLLPGVWVVDVLPICTFPALRLYVGTNVSQLNVFPIGSQEYHSRNSARNIGNQLGNSPTSPLTL